MSEHPRTSCKHAKAGNKTSTIVCAIGAAPENSHVGVCRACPSYSGPARGLGDVVEVVTRITGIKAITQAVAKVRGKPCNCGKRRAALNQAVPLGNSQPCDGCGKKSQS